MTALEQHRWTLILAVVILVLLILAALGVAK